MPAKILKEPKYEGADTWMARKLDLLAVAAVLELGKDSKLGYFYQCHNLLMGLYFSRMKFKSNPTV